MSDNEIVLDNKNSYANTNDANLAVVLPSVASSIRAFPEICSTYDNVVSRLAEINNDYSIAATKAISLHDQYFPKTLSDSFNRASQSYASIFDKVDSLLPSFDKVAAISPFLESARNANIAIQSISGSYLQEGLLNLNKVTTSYLNTFQDQYKAIFPTINDSFRFPQLATESFFPKIDTAVFALLKTDFIDRVETLKFSVESSFSRIAECSIAAESCLARLPWENIASLSGLIADNRISIRDSFLDATHEYRCFWDTYKANPLEYIVNRPEIARLTPIEHYWNANLLEAISTPVDKEVPQTDLSAELLDETDNGLSTLLPKLNPSLLNLWVGARQALNSKNPDRIRHFTTSIRELFTHVLHSLAPDQEIRKWTAEPIHYHNGNPTRKARLLYICREINNNGFVSFVKSDVKAIIEFIDLFNEGTHAITPSFSESQIIAIKAKSESTLKFILEIAQNRK